MKLEGLKAVVAAERMLMQRDVQSQIKKLEAYKDDPEIAKALEYLQRYKEPIPENHQIFSYLNRKEIQTDIKNRDESDKAKEEACKIGDAINHMLHNLEKDLDKLYAFYEENKKMLNTDLLKITSSQRLKKFLIGTKSAINGARIK